MQHEDHDPHGIHIRMWPLSGHAGTRYFTNPVGGYYKLLIVQDAHRAVAKIFEPLDAMFAEAREKMRRDRMSIQTMIASMSLYNTASNGKPEPKRVD